MLDRLALSTTDELYLLGDYVDRGPDSKGVLDTIFHLQKTGYQVHCLMGNHEELVLTAAAENVAGLERWLSSDASYTMKSFGVQSIPEIPEEYLRWMAALPYYLEAGQYILVHAGLDFSNPDPLAVQEKMCWIRHWYDDIRYDWLGDRIILHGHTPVFTEVIEDQWAHLQKNRYLDIDSGCVFSHERFTNKAGLGFLCAFDMNNQTLLFQKNIDY